MASYSGVFAYYLSNFNTYRGQQRTYYGTTQLLVGQTASEACAVRLKYHKNRPLKAIEPGITRIETEQAR